ncbi:MAG: hydroxymethylbilane synthase [Actinomycetota bacterium]
MTSGSAGLRIGTRRSALAMAQATSVRDTLTALGHACEIVPMSTRGDSGAPIEAGSAGLKGLFVDEIVNALIRGDIDVAVHSAKDLPAFDVEGAVVAAVPSRADAHDVLVTREPSLVSYAHVGTSSLRRRAQFRRSRPELEIVELRGNVDSRLKKLEAGDVDGLLLAAAGLSRLGLQPTNVETIEFTEMLPAPAQGFLALQTRISGSAHDTVVALDDPYAHRAWETERYLVRLLGADCALPVGAHAITQNASLSLVAAVFSLDGATRLITHRVGAAPADVARAAAEDLLAQGAGDVLAPYLTQAEAS